MSGTDIDELETHITSHLLEVETWKHNGKTITLQLNKQNDPFQTMGAPLPSFSEQIGGNGDAKTSLNQFCQKYCKKAIQKSDVVYTTTKVGAGYQCTVKLNCIGELEFAGEIACDAKTAEKSAAQMALDHHADVIANMPGSAKKQKRSSGTIGLNFDRMDGSSPKAELNVTISKILRQVISKTDIAYEVSQVEGQGFQATVQMPSLPGHYATQVWAGEVAGTKLEAEQSAAQQAVSAIRIDPTLMAIASQPTSAQQKRNAKGNPFCIFTGKGRGKHKGKTMQDVVNAMNAMSAMGLPNSLGGGKGGF